MKMLSKLSILPCIFLGFAANAQTETVTSAPKMHPQLYLSVGTGPALTTNKDSHPWGGTYVLNITGACGSGSVYRLNVQHSEFFSEHDPKTGPFTYLGSNSYYSPYFTARDNTSISLAYGRQKKLNNFVQLQVLGGIGFNKISELHYYSIGFDRTPSTPEVTYLPGILLQAEAMFLPTCFAGLTLGGYYHYVPEISNGGLTLSLNLGLLRRKE